MKRETNEELYDFVNRNFGEWYADTYQSDLITESDEFEEVIRTSVEERKGIRLVGPVGSGKTFLTIRYLERLKEYIGEEPLYTLVDVYHESELYGMIREGAKPSFKKIVIIDDFLSVKFPDWMISDYEYLFHLLHKDRKILILTTNVEDQVFRETYERAYSRLIEMAVGYILPSGDRRVKNKKESDEKE